MLRISQRFLFFATLCCVAPVVLLGQGWQHIGNVQKVERLPDGVELTSGKAKVRVTAFRDGIFRVRVAPAGAFPKDFSWAVIESAQPPAVKIDDSKDEVRVTAGAATARIHKSPLLIDFVNEKGEALVADNPDLPMGWADGAVCV